METTYQRNNRETIHAQEKGLKILKKVKKKIFSSAKSKNQEL